MVTNDLSIKEIRTEPIMKLLEQLIAILAYHDELNPKIWKDAELRSDVKQHLMKISSRFIESLKIPDSAIKDYVITGSNANFNWTKYSDVDVHIIVDYNNLDCENCSVEIEDCLLAKKSLWNDRHEIEIRGHPVELYVSNAKDSLVADSGCYSLLNDKWIKKPVNKAIKIDNDLVNMKAEELANQIDSIINSKTNEKESIDDITDRIWNYRKSGLEKGGEFSIENLVFKSLRNNGYLDKIKKYSLKASDDELSL